MGPSFPVTYKALFPDGRRAFITLRPRVRGIPAGGGSQPPPRTMTKIFLYAAAVFLLLSAGLSYVNKNKLADKQNLLANAQTETNAARGDAAKAKADQKKAETARSEAESKANDLQNQLTTAASEATTLKGQVDTATANVAAKQQEIDTLNQRLAAATPPPAMTPAPEITAALDKANHQLAELQVIKDGLEGQLKSARDAQQAAQRNLAIREGQEALNGLQGRVLAVDRNWNFVVLNLGGRSGVNTNAQMIVRRGGSMVGRVRITSVEPAQSIADIVPNSVPAGVSVQAGDTVVFAGGS